MTSFVCTVCEGTTTAHVYDARDYITGEVFALWRCRTCMSLHTTPQPKDADMPRYYGAAYYGNRKSAADSIINVGRERWIARIGAQKGHLLDVGCGSGSFLRSMMKNGWHVSGIEISSLYDFSDIENGGGVIHHDDMRTCALESDAYDVVTFWHVLEHLMEPATYMKEVMRVLRPGGHLIVEVPNSVSWQARLGKANWFHLDVPRHIVHLTPEALRILAMRAGFRVKRIAYRSFFYDVFGMTQTILNMVTNRKNFLFDVLGGKATFFSYKKDALWTILLLPFAVSLGVVLFIPGMMMGKGSIMTLIAVKE